MAILALVPIFSSFGASIGGALFGGAAATATTAATGGFAAGAFGGMIVGAAAGSFIDQTFIFPLLTKSQGNAGPRVNDRSVQLAAEGSSMMFALGKTNRFAGTVIWSSDLIEEKSKVKSQGGKGGSGSAGKQTVYTYSLHCAVGVCEGPITAIRKIWADAKVIYDDDLGAGHKIDKRITGSMYVTSTFLGRS